VYNCRGIKAGRIIIRAFVEILLELHGDRGFNDKAMIGGLGKLVVNLYDCWSTKDITKTRQ
jgi:hypothetical protein